MKFPFNKNMCSTWDLSFQSLKEPSNTQRITSALCVWKSLSLTIFLSMASGQAFVDRGDLVVKGQALAVLESGVEEAEVALAETRATMQSEISARKADLKLAKLQIDRFKDLHTKNIVSSQQRDEATARYRIAGAALIQAEENNELQELELLRTQRQFELRTVTSPFDGVVVSQKTFPGEYIHDNAVMKVAALHPLRIEVVLPARLFGSIKPGDTARLYPELTHSGESMEALVDVVDALLDTRSGTFGVRLEVSNEDYKIPAGQRCRIMFDPKVAAAISTRAINPSEKSNAELETQ